MPTQQPRKPKRRRSSKSTDQNEIDRKYEWVAECSTCGKLGKFRHPDEGFPGQHNIRRGRVVYCGRFVNNPRPDYTKPLCRNTDAENGVNNETENTNIAERTDAEQVAGCTSSQQSTGDRNSNRCDNNMISGSNNRLVGPVDKDSELTAVVYTTPVHMQNTDGSDCFPLCDSLDNGEKHETCIKGKPSYSAISPNNPPLGSGSVTKFAFHSGDCLESDMCGAKSTTDIISQRNDVVIPIALEDIDKRCLSLFACDMDENQSEGRGPIKGENGVSEPDTSVLPSMNRKSTVSVWSHFLRNNTSSSELSSSPGLTSEYARPLYRPSRLKRKYGRTRV
mmetsp:Transcript_6385/g.9632  ORF Transcript_6385/g.9632 Transcript_6385/m.9632 type:complete len:335 (-) Transcript_6385:232-1236(-)